MFSGFSQPSHVIALLDKPDLSLTELLDEQDLLQELKSHNTKLVEYLREPEILKQLLDIIITEDAEFKYALTASEVLSSEVWSISEALVENRELIDEFWTYLDRVPPLNPLQAAYFNKVNEQLLDKKTDEMISFIQSIPNVIEKILKHIETSAIMDLLMKIMSMEKTEAGNGVVDWLEESPLLDMLLEQTSPSTHADTQATVSDILKAIISISAYTNDQGAIGPNSLSRRLCSAKSVEILISHMLDKGGEFQSASLANGVGIVIEMIRRNYRWVDVMSGDYELEPMLSLSLDTHPPSTRDPVYLGPLLRTFASHTKDFQALLTGPAPKMLKTTFGDIEPLGFGRFRICELFAELFHCSNVALVNDRQSEKIAAIRDEERERLRKRRKSMADDEESDDEREPRVTPRASLDLDGEPDVTSTVGDYLKMQFIEHQVIPTILDIFFRFPWNNILHHVVFDIIQQVFTGPMDRPFHKMVVFDLFERARITERIIEGTRRSAESEHGRLGYMGHLSIIAEEVVKFTQRYPLSVNDGIVWDLVTSDEWIDYVENTLVETRQKDQTPLGGGKPEQIRIPPQGNATTTFETDELRSDSDQFAAYISEQITHDIPDKFGSSDEDDEDEDVVGWSEGNEDPDEYDKHENRLGGFMIESEETAQIRDAATRRAGNRRRPTATIPSSHRESLDDEYSEELQNLADVQLETMEALENDDVQSSSDVGTVASSQDISDLEEEIDRVEYADTRIEPVHDFDDNDDRSKSPEGDFEAVEVEVRK